MKPTLRRTRMNSRSEKSVTSSPSTMTRPESGLSKPTMCKDPHSEEISQQPEYAQNPYRSIRAEYLIVMGVCTHLGCAPSFKPEHGFKQAGEWWRGGFYCACHQSIYDLSGRVFKDSLAPMNLPVPPHHFLTKTRIRIGDQSLAKT